MEECSLKYLIDNQRKCSEEQYNEEYTYLKGHFYCVENWKTNNFTMSPKSIDQEKYI